MSKQKPVIEYVDIDTVKPNPKNPRVIPDRAVDAVAKSIDTFGFLVPIVIGKGGVVGGGHTRLKAARKLGLKVVPVVNAKHLTKRQLEAFMLVDNKTTELTGWNEGLLADFASQFEVGELPGWTQDDLDDLQTFQQVPPESQTVNTNSPEGKPRPTKSNDPTKAVTIYFRCPEVLKASLSIQIRAMIKKAVEQAKTDGVLAADFTMPKDDDDDHDTLDG